MDAKPATLLSRQTVATPRYQEKREAILAAAALLFDEQGVRGTALSTIASSVGLVTNSVTYYYRKKEDLATACFLRSIEVLAGIATSAAKAGGVPVRVQAFLDLHARLLTDIGEGRRPPIVMFNDIRALPDTLASEVFAAYTAMYRLVRTLLRGPETQHLGRDDLNARTHILLSVVNWMRTWIDRYETETYPRIATRVGDILLHGVAGPKTRWHANDERAAWQLSSAVEGISEDFLRAATALVNEQGYRGASVDKISARLNMTKGAFYHHNDTKHDLISECFERTFAVTRQALRRAEESPGSGWDRTCAVARALIRFQLSDAGPLLRSSATSALPDRQHREAVGATMRQLSERLASVVVDGMMDGSIRPLDPAVAAQVATAAINAAAELQRWVAGATVDNVPGLYVRPVMEGLLCPGVASG